MVAVAALVIGLLVVWVKFYDTKRQREAEAAHVQGRVADALLQDPRFSRALVIPTAEVAIWPRSSLTLVMSGEVPSPELREAAVRIAEAEAARIRADARVEDRVMVLPAARQAA